MKTVWCRITSSSEMTRRSCVSGVGRLDLNTLTRDTVGQIVALQNDVLALNKKQLKRPTRASLAPAHSVPSHSDIVNSPW